MLHEYLTQAENRNAKGSRCVSCGEQGPCVAHRKRHWSRLMEITGQEFEMDPKTFTLGSMFAMKLHNHVEEVSTVTNMAIKELTIESEIKKLAEVWKDHTFEIQKYIKVPPKPATNNLFPYYLMFVWDLTYSLMRYAITVKIFGWFRELKIVALCCVQPMKYLCF